MNKKLIKYLLIGIIATLVATYLLPEKRTEQPIMPRDYDAIKQSGVIRATTEYNAISYFVEGDTVSGLHYELLHAFAKEHGLWFRQDESGNVIIRKPATKFRETYTRIG